MARIGVLGGRGTAGSPTVAELERRGHDVRVLSRATGFDVTAPAAGPLDGLDVLVDCLNATSPRAAAARAVLVDGLRRTLDVAARVGVDHVVSLSILGSDRIPYAYYRVKQEQEALVRSSPLPATILRATQFPQLFDATWRATVRIGVLLAPRGVVAPVDPRDVASTLADAVETGPGGPATRALRGPEVLEIRDVARAWRTATGSRRPIVGLPALGGALRAVRAGHLADRAAPAGTRTFAAWLAEERV